VTAHTCKSNPGYCTSISECSIGQSCDPLIHACYIVSCSRDSDCSPGYVCNIYRSCIRA
jgi:hypothetical protein